MTTRYSGVLVTFDREIREDDLESLMEALRHFRHVVRVEPAPVDGWDVAMAKSQLRRELHKKVYDLFINETE